MSSSFPLCFYTPRSSAPVLVIMHTRWGRGRREEGRKEGKEGKARQARQGKEVGGRNGTV